MKTKDVLLATAVTVWSLHGCAPRASSDGSGCPGPAARDSLIAEILRDTTGTFPTGGFGNRQVHVTDEIVFGDVAGQHMSVTAVEATPRYSGFYRIGMVGDRAYRLRGWECDNLSDWLRLMPPFSVRSEGDVWAAIHRLAVALNPVGDSARLFDPDDVTGLGADRKFAALDSPGGTAASVWAVEGGGWEGNVTIMWFHSGAHGLDGVTWTFQFDGVGRLSRLTETELLGPMADSRRTLVGG